MADNPRCMPTGSVCCPGGVGYCNAGNTCTADGKCQPAGGTCDAGKVVCGTSYAPFHLPRGPSHQRLTTPDVCLPAASAAPAASATATRATPVQPTANARPPAALVMQARWSAAPGTPLPHPSRVRSQPSADKIPDACPLMASVALAVLATATQAIPVQPTASARPPVAPPAAAAPPAPIPRRYAPRRRQTPRHSRPIPMTYPTPRGRAPAARAAAPLHRRRLLRRRLGRRRRRLRRRRLPRDFVCWGGAGWLVLLEVWWCCFDLPA